MVKELLSAERQYLDLLEDIRDNGTEKSDRTGTGTRSLFGEQMKIDLRDGLPVLTTKKVFTRAIIYELLWMIKGDQNLQYLAQNNVNIWNEWPFVSYLERTGQTPPPQNSEEWNGLMQEFLEQIRNDDGFAAEFGDLGPVYGKQWRHVDEPSSGTYIDQLADAQDALRSNPDSRRIIVNSWNVSELHEMSRSGLPPCHALYQFYTADGNMDLKLYQRSADMFLGVPFNMVQYALLGSMMAQSTGHTARYFVHSFGDTHIYNNHLNQVDEQLSREPRAMPTLRLNPEIKDVFDFTADDITIEGYDPHPPIKAPVAI
jgi:thymidylate synthase